MLEGPTCEHTGCDLHEEGPECNHTGQSDVDP